jgi:hypothetical protein
MTCDRDNEPLILTQKVAKRRRWLSPWDALNNFIQSLADLFDEDFPIASGNVQSAASILSLEGHRKRKESEAEKRLRVHTELEAYVTAKRAGVAQ